MRLVRALARAHTRSLSRARSLGMSKNSPPRPFATVGPNALAACFSLSRRYRSTRTPTAPRAPSSRQVGLLAPLARENRCAGSPCAARRRRLREAPRAGVGSPLAPASLLAAREPQRLAVEREHIRQTRAPRREGAAQRRAIMTPRPPTERCSQKQGARLPGLDTIRRARRRRINSGQNWRCKINACRCAPGTRCQLAAAAQVNGALQVGLDAGRGLGRSGRRASSLSPDDRWPRARAASLRSYSGA